jgi:hypothetical protein
MLHQPDPEKLQAETVTTHHETIDGVNSLAYHEETPKTPEEAKAERNLVRKIDFIILPILASMYFLASLVSTVPLLVDLRAPVLTYRYRTVEILGTQQWWACQKICTSALKCLATVLLCFSWAI